MSKSWSAVSSLYQIYPRSFQDLSGDGIGDLNGITSRLDYLQELGIDAIWISPFFTSPMTDFGYDVADYRDVDPTFGRLDDFCMLLDEAHSRDIKVMIDLVPCHTSDQHPWFVEARASRDNPKRDYFVWRDPVDGHEPNNWRSLSGGRDWTYDENSGQYYLHSFLATQPDLNWDNPEVRREMKDVVRFWFDMGVDGMRVDAIWGISKDPELGDDSPNPDFDGDPDSYGAFIHDHCKHGPHFAEYLHELASVCDEYDDRQMVFEFYPDEKLGDIWQQYGEVIQTHPRAAAFFMEHRQNNWHADATGWNILSYLRACGDNLPFFCVGNHDQPRVVSRLGFERARALQFLNLLCPGVSVIYYGEEIGMENGILNEEEVRDKFSPNNSRFDSRDLERTPMQWNTSRYAGFSGFRPWLPVHKNFRRINVQTLKKDPNSILNLHKRLLALRRETPLITHGKLEKIDSGNGFVLAFRHSLDDQRGYTLINFADSEQEIYLPEPGCIVISTHQNSSQNDRRVTLPGYCGAFIRPYDQ